MQRRGWGLCIAMLRLATCKPGAMKCSAARLQRRPTAHQQVHTRSFCALLPSLLAMFATITEACTHDISRSAILCSNKK
jgi:hypothetical protein